MKLKQTLIAGLVLAVATTQFVQARSFRQLMKIPVAPKQIQSKGTQPGKPFAPVDRAFVEKSVRRILQSWNGEGLADYLDVNFQDRALLLSAIGRSVPMDARLELLAVHNIQTVEQQSLPNKGSGKQQRQSVVVATVELQLTFNDPFNGQVRLPHTSQFYLQITEPEA